MKKNVIIFGSPLITTISLVKSLYGYGYSIIEIIEPCDKHMCSLQYSRYVDKVYFLEKLEDGIDIILKYKDPNNIIPILCSSDSSILLLDQNYNLLKDSFYFFNANEQGRICFYLNKINTFPVAEKAGLTVIKTWLVNDIYNLPDDITFPCLTKGNNSTESGKDDMYICQNAEELKACLHDGVEYLIQEYIKKEYELDFVGLAYNHGNDVYIPAVVRKLRDDIHRQSVFVRLDDINEYPNFDLNIINRFIKEIHYEGIFSIETIFSNGKYYFLEINLRNDGCQCVYRAAGINYPLLWVKYVEGELTKEMLSSGTFKNHLYQMRKDDIRNVIEGKVSLFVWIVDFIRTKSFLGVDFLDPMPVFWGTLISVRQLLKKVVVLLHKG